MVMILTPLTSQVFFIKCLKKFILFLKFRKSILGHQYNLTSRSKRRFFRFQSGWW